MRGRGIARREKKRASVFRCTDTRMMGREKRRKKWSGYQRARRAERRWLGGKGCEERKEKGQKGNWMLGSLGNPCEAIEVHPPVHPYCLSNFGGFHAFPFVRASLSPHPLSTDADCQGWTRGPTFEIDKSPSGDLLFFWLTFSRGE